MPAAVATKPLIFSKMIAIQRGLGVIEKDGEGPATQSSFKYLSIDNIITHLTPLLNEHGVFMTPGIVKDESEYRYGQDAPTFLGNGTDGDSSLAIATLAGKMWSGRVAAVRIRQTVVVEYTFYAEDGSSVTASVFGEGIDNGERASRKAMTSALKTALLQVFSIATGELDPDAVDVNDQAEGQATPAQKSAAAQKIEKAGPTGSSTTPPQRSASTDPRPAAKEKTALEIAKANLRKAVADVKERGIDANTEMIDGIGMKLHNEPRAKWITNAKKVDAIATALAAGDVA